MPDIGEYTDYKKFLQDYYQEARKKNPGFSYRVFTERAGIKSRGFLYNVVQGRRSLSKSNIFALAQAMRLNKFESDYFENLVAFNDAATLKERNHFYEKLSAIKLSGNTAWKPRIIRNEQFEYYSKIHYSIIRSLIDLRGFNGDYQALAKAVRPRITPGQARKAVELLERLGFVKKQKGGYAVTGKSITTEPEVESLAVINLHKQAGELALKALEELPKKQRNVTGVTLGISQQVYERICEEIEAFRMRLLQIAEADVAADSVYQLNFQFFPVSMSPVRRKKP